MKSYIHNNRTYHYYHNTSRNSIIVSIVKSSGAFFTYEFQIYYPDYPRTIYIDCNEYFPIPLEVKEVLDLYIKETQ